MKYLVLLSLFFFSIDNTHAGSQSLAEKLVGIQHSHDEASILAMFKQTIEERKADIFNKILAPQKKGLIEEFSEAGCREEGQRAAKKLDTLIPIIEKKCFEVLEKSYKNQEQKLIKAFGSFYAQNFTDAELNELINVANLPASEKERRLLPGLAKIRMQQTDEFIDKVFAPELVKEMIESLTSENGELRQEIVKIVEQEVSPSCKFE